MKVALLAFTKNGVKLAQKTADRMQGCSVFAPQRFAGGGVRAFGDSLGGFMGKAFEAYQAFVFFGACGIAVRAVAPFLKSKTTDPAVVCADEQGTFVVSLLSGHIGGANTLAKAVAKILGAQPVILTATDRNGVFSVDEWATKNEFCIINPRAIKHIASALIEKKPVFLESALECSTALPEGLTTQLSEQRIKIQLNTEENLPETTLLLVPKILHIGIGCKKGAKAEQIRRAVFEILEENKLPICAVKDISSIDLKKEEQGILALQEEIKKPFCTFSAEQLKDVHGTASSSAFVEKVAGVDTVCERTALKSAGSGGRLVLKKTIRYSVAVAVAAEQKSISFEGESDEDEG